MRTRFAPSPTGYMHIGNLKTALFGYLLARSMGGVFALRIEDTDLAREVAGATDVIYDSLRAAGICWDEGPDIGGDFGPYVQSQRKSNYLEFARELIGKGAAYYCFCDKERLAELARADGGGIAYDRHCVGLAAEDIAAKLAQGAAFVVRQLIPPGATTFSDEIYGNISVNNSELDDQVLIKSDGMPTYNFANVVDDHLMEITHVIRGSEYLSSAPKYTLLYQAFGWDVPKYLHLNLLINDDGSKLSKRSGDASFQDLVAAGFLPAAIVNYIVLLGWSPPENREIYTMAELADIFDIRGLSKSPSKFDEDKLRWINGEYLKAMDAGDFYEMAKDELARVVSREGADLRRLAGMVQGRISLVSEINEHLDFIDNLPKYSNDLYVHKKSKCDTDIAKKVLNEILPELAARDDWRNDGLYEAMCDFAARAGLKNAQVLWPIRTALSGKAATPGGASEIADILGKDESLSRIEMAIGQLG